MLCWRKWFNTFISSKIWWWCIFSYSASSDLSGGVLLTKAERMKPPIMLLCDTLSSPCSESRVLTGIWIHPRLDLQPQTRIFHWTAGRWWGRGYLCCDVPKPTQNEISSVPLWLIHVNARQKSSWFWNILPWELHSFQDPDLALMRISNVRDIKCS